MIEKLVVLLHINTTNIIVPTSTEILAVPITTVT